MSTPIRTEQAAPLFLHVAEHDENYQAELADGTVLWIPKDSGNSDAAAVQAWAEANDVE